MILNPFVKAAIKSLREEPDRWYESNTGYEIEHPRTGLAIWTGNSVFGMDINYNRTVVWGGVTLLSVVYLSINHWALWFAVRRWKKARFTCLIDRLSEKPE